MCGFVRTLRMVAHHGMMVLRTKEKPRCRTVRETMNTITHPADARRARELARLNAAPCCDRKHGSESPCYLNRYGVQK